MEIKRSYQSFLRCCSEYEGCSHGVDTEYTGLIGKINALVVSGYARATIKETDRKLRETLRYNNAAANYCER